MPAALVRVACNLFLAGFVLGSLSASAADLGQGSADRSPGQSRPTAVRFADGSDLPPDQGTSLLTGLPAPTPAPRQSSPPNTSAPSEPAALPPAAAAPANRGAPLAPVPESKNLGTSEIEVTSFHGITPGSSTRSDVEKAWGKPKDTRKLDTGAMQLYAVAPFPRVEVLYANDNKVISLVIRFQSGFPAAQVAEQLELAKVQPVLVSNELGEVLGQSYPERGVLFSFEPATDPGKALKKVTHIVLESITAEPFVLRAETNIESRPESSLHDSEQALKLQAGNARAHWLRSRALTTLGQHDLAVAPAAEAVRLEPRDARYMVTKAQALQQVGNIPNAIAAAEQAFALSGQRPHVKARATCLMGDLKGAGPRPDYKQALQFHTQALHAANALIADKHPAIRVAAKEVLLDAHLGALHDISWSTWREKEASAAKWIAEATNIALDLVKAEDGSDELLFRVSAKALSADVGLRGKLDPVAWAREVVRSGEVLTAAAPEPGRKAELHWQIAMALYDAMQIYQMRSEQEEALRHGQLAIQYLEKSGRHTKVASAAYLLGRTYFRIGAVYANNRQDHRTAVSWFEKAIPLLGKTPPREAQIDLGRLGDSFVSMGVSYWSAGDRKKAVALTQHGADLIEEAVRRGNHDRSVLAVPYANLAAMQRELGAAAAAAAHMQELAEKAKGTTFR